MYTRDYINNNFLPHYYGAIIISTLLNLLICVVYQLINQHGGQ